LFPELLRVESSPTAAHFAALYLVRGWGERRRLEGWGEEEEEEEAEEEE
jgi:hypothetical protein